jgi:hypothetical protein
MNEYNLTTTYWVLLWMLSVHIVIVIPSLLGSTIVNNVFGYYFFPINNNDNRRNASSSSSSLFAWRKLPWWIRFTLGFFLIILKNIVYRGIITACYCVSGTGVFGSSNKNNNNNNNNNNNCRRSSTTCTKLTSSSASSTGLSLSIHDEESGVGTLAELSTLDPPSSRPNVIFL